MDPLRELGWWIWGTFTVMFVVSLFYTKETLAQHGHECVLPMLVVIIGNALRLGKRLRGMAKSEIEMGLILHPGAVLGAVAFACLAWKQSH
jgi:hypothetical protein